MRAKSWIKLAVIVVVIALVSVLALNGLKFSDFTSNTKIGKYRILPVGEAMGLGIDLEGGYSIVYQAADSTVENFDKLMNNAVRMIRARLAGSGYDDATARRQGTDKILVEIPNVDDLDAATQTIGKRGLLEFRDPSGNVIFEGKNIKTAVPGKTTDGTYVVSFELDKEGTKAFADATLVNKGKAISIYQDDELISSPTVNDVITDGKGAIPISTAADGLQEAQRFAALILSGALPLDFNAVETSAIGATLGEGATGGLAVACIVALAAFVVILIALYRLPGVAASLALIVFALAFSYALAIARTEITLAGVAGMFASLFVFVAATVILLERFREEMGAGRTPLNALKFGYKGGLSTVTDIAVVALIAAIVLLLVGAGSVKGFAAALIVGTPVSYVAAAFIARWFLKIILKLGYQGDGLYRR